MPNSMLQPSDRAECGAGQVIDNDKRPCDRLALAITLARFHPPPISSTGRCVKNPQLAAPVAVQFQNSEARLLQSHFEEWGELFQNPVTHGRLVVALLPEALAFHDQR